MDVLGFVSFQIGDRQVQIEEVLPPGEMQGAGRGQCSALLVEQVGDILGAVDLKIRGVFQRTDELLARIEFAQRHDLSNMMPGVEMPVFELPIKVFRFGRELEEVLQQALFP